MDPKKELKFLQVNQESPIETTGLANIIDVNYMTILKEIYSKWESGKGYKRELNKLKNTLKEAAGNCNALVMNYEKLTDVERFILGIILSYMITDTERSVPVCNMGSMIRISPYQFMYIIYYCKEIENKFVVINQLKSLKGKINWIEDETRQKYLKEHDAVQVQIIVKPENMIMAGLIWDRYSINKMYYYNNANGIPELLKPLVEPVEVLLHG